MMEMTPRISSGRVRTGVCAAGFTQQFLVIGTSTTDELQCICGCVSLQVVRHERASIKADIWSYGILIWELVTGEDITEYQPLSISRQVRP
jgi:serine/threonine protein kinase